MVLLKSWFQNGDAPLDFKHLGKKEKQALLDKERSRDAGIDTYLFHKYLNIKETIRKGDLSGLEEIRLGSMLHYVFLSLHLFSLSLSLSISLSLPLSLSLSLSIYIYIYIFHFPSFFVNLYSAVCLSVATILAI